MKTETNSSEWRIRMLAAAALTFAIALGPVGCGVEPSSDGLPEEDVNFVNIPAGQTLAAGGNGGGNGTNRGTTFKTFVLDGKKGGTFTFRKITTKFPPKTVSGRYEVRISQPDPNVAIWDLNIEPHREFSKPVTLTIDYGGISEASSHYITWFDEHTETWVNLGGIEDHGNQNIKVELSHFSRYGLVDGTSGWD